MKLPDWLKKKFETKTFGVPVPVETKDDPKPVQGKDFPEGIDNLDLSWFEKKFTLEKLAASKTPEDLQVLRVQADFVCWLKQLQQKSKET